MQAYALTPTIDWPGSGRHVMSCSSNAGAAREVSAPEDRGMAERALLPVWAAAAAGATIAVTLLLAGSADK